MAEEFLRRRSKIDAHEIELVDQKKFVQTETIEVAEGEVSENADALQRRLSNRQIQLIAIGGSIGKYDRPLTAVGR